MLHYGTFSVQLNSIVALNRNLLNFQLVCAKGSKFNTIKRYSFKCKLKSKVQAKNKSVRLMTKRMYSFIVPPGIT